MRSFTFVLAACLLASALAIPTFTTDQASCVSKLSLPCSSSDSACSSALSTTGQCIAKDCILASSAADYGKCISETCKSSNSSIATYYSSYAACLSTSTTTTTSVSSFNADQAKCVSALNMPCSNTDSTCLKAQTEASLCIAQKCNSAGSAADFGSCINETCKSSNSAIATYYSGYAGCLRSQNLAFIGMALFSLLALLF